MVPPCTERRRRRLRWAGFAFAILASIVPVRAGDPVPLDIKNWQLVLPSKAFATQPALRPTVEYSAENDLQSLVFVCGEGRFHVLIVSPAFKYPRAAKGELTVGGGGPVLTLAFRDLYRAPARGAPRLNWDADILYAEIEPEDLSQLSAVNNLVLTFAGRAWRLPLPGFAKAMPAFLTYCATGKVIDRSVIGE